MKNVTISIEETVAQFAKVAGAKQGKSLSRFINDFLRSLMDDGKERERARREFFSRGAYFSSGGRKISREEMHER